MVGLFAVPPPPPPPLVIAVSAGLNRRPYSVLHYRLVLSWPGLLFFLFPSDLWTIVFHLSIYFVSCVWYIGPIRASCPPLRTHDCRFVSLLMDRVAGV